jgi:hypothetical protein
MSKQNPKLERGMMPGRIGRSNRAKKELFEEENQELGVEELSDEEIEDLSRFAAVKKILK